ncbi:MAG: hypothetical protein PHX34_03985 [Candidatus Shapirobacteria bacterium]|nr:hypothetical protein [Candidatus Shapirobacteria bacterium]
MKKYKKSVNKKIIWFLAIVLIFLTIFLGVVLSKQPKNKEEQLDSNDQSVTEDMIIKQIREKDLSPEVVKEMVNDKFELPSSINTEIVNILKQSYLILDQNVKNLDIKGTIKVNTTGGVTWESPDGFTILDSNSPNVEWWLVDRFMGRETFNEQIIGEIRQFKLKALSLIEKKFTENNFVKNTAESVNYPNTNIDTGFDYSISIYNKGDIKCTIVTGKDNNQPTSITISCSDQYNKNYQIQSKILKDLNIKNQGLNLNLSKIVGRYAYFWLGYDHAIAMMDATDKWHILYKGQDMPPCDLVAKDKIPKSVVEYCYSNNKEQKNLIE